MNNKQTLACIALLTLLTSANLNGYSRSKLFQYPTKDTLENVVQFDVDDPAFEKGKMKDIGLYTLDSLGWGKGFGVVTPSQKNATNVPLLLLQPNATQTPFLVYPHEKINIRYAGTDTMQMYVKGNAMRTNELNFFRKLVQKTGNIYYYFAPMPYQRTVSSLNEIHLLEKTIDSVKNSRLRYLTLYSRQFPVSSSFVKIAVNCIKSVSIDDSLLLYNNNGAMLKKANIYAPLAIAKVAGINRIGFEPYPIFFQACKHLVAMATGTNPMDIGDIKGAALARRLDFIIKNFNGDTKNFLLAQTINVAHRNKALSKIYLDKFDKECTGKSYRDLIHHKLTDDAKEIKVAMGANKLLSLDLKTVQDLNTVILKNKGKLILLDFWASWCGPCRAEMPYTALLRKKFEGKKIVFITLSTDEHMSDWKKAALEEGMKSETNFLLLNSAEASITKTYGINAIPRYMLIGKNGKILEADAPRPSDKDVEKLINRYL